MQKTLIISIVIVNLYEKKKVTVIVIFINNGVQA